MTPTYRSRGLGDKSGQQTSKYILNWPEIKGDALANFETRVREQRARQEKREAAFRQRRPVQLPGNAGVGQPKGDRKGDRGPEGKPPKGDTVTANYVLLLGGRSSSRRQLKNGVETSSSTDPTLPASDWDAELSGGDGVTFETLTGSVTIPGDVAERWVSWMGTDGVLVLESASMFLVEQGLVAPDKFALMLFLAEYARWVAQGHDRNKLVALTRGFTADWAKRTRSLEARP